MTFGLYLSDKCLLDKKSIPGRDTVWVKAEWCERTKHICPHLVTFPLLFCSDESRLYLYPTSAI